MQDRHGGLYFKMYDRRHVGDDIEGYCPPGGHMHLYPGEKAMTFECPRDLTFWATDPQTGKKEEVTRAGVIALAVQTYPDFNIRTCGTFHLIDKCYVFILMSRDFAICLFDFFVFHHSTIHVASHVHKAQ